jgi:hypothetical protein
MRRTAIALALALALASVLPAAAEDPGGKYTDLGGKYTVEGRDPSGQVYVGEAAVVRKGDTYQVFWVLGTSQAVGTGMMAGDVFAVTYVIRGVPAPGLALYDVDKNGALSGRFTMLGAEIIGEETWTPTRH